MTEFGSAARIALEHQGFLLMAGFNPKPFLSRRDLLAGKLKISLEDARRELAGHDLACWCSLDGPCHADVLIEIANSR